MTVLLISTYELGRQPFGLASPTAWLRRAGHEVACQDLSQCKLDADLVRNARLICFYLPMHTATRIALQVTDRVRELNPEAHLCCYGLYAPVNADLLRSRGVETILGGECEGELVQLANNLARQKKGRGTTGSRALRDREGISASAAGAHDLCGEIEITSGAKAHTSKVCRMARLKAVPLPKDAETEAVALPNGSQIERRPSQGPLQSPLWGCGPENERQQQIPKLQFVTPDRAGLPALKKYARLKAANGEERIVGYTEASRGCRHLCRHCPVVPIYNGAFRIVQRDVVLEDIRQQVAAGAEHITFGDPDFFNGPGHAVAIVEALHREFPAVSYDVTIKIEHLLKFRDHLPVLRDTGCAFVTTAVESIDDRVLALLEKGHTRADFVRAVELMSKIGLPLAPTFIPFTLWTTLTGYAELLRTIAELDLIENVAPVQLAIRLLIPAGSRLLELAEVRERIGAFDPELLSYHWRNPDPQVDELQQQIEAAVAQAGREELSRAETFARVWAITKNLQGRREDGRNQNSETRISELRIAPLVARAAIPYLTEPWYC